LFRIPRRIDMPESTISDELREMAQEVKRFGEQCVQAGRHWLNERREDMTHREHEGHRDHRPAWQREQERDETRYGRGGRSPYDEQSEYSARVQRQNRGYERGRDEYYGNRQFGERSQAPEWEEGRSSARASWEYEGGPERYGSSGYSEGPQERWSREYGAQPRGQPLGGRHEQGIYRPGSADYYRYQQRYAGDYPSGYGERSVYTGAPRTEWRGGHSGGSDYGTRSVYGGESAGSGGRGALYGGEYTENTGVGGGYEEEWAGNRYSHEAARHAYAGFGTGQGYRGMGPKNYRRSDERLTEELNERLTDADDLDATEISVRVADGKVTLEGNVDRRWMKHRAEDIADACIGVKEVDNRISVTPSSSELGRRDTTGRTASRTTTTAGGTMTDENRSGSRGATPH